MKSWMRRLKAKRWGKGVMAGEDEDVERVVDISAVFGDGSREAEVHWSSVWVVDEVGEGDYGDPGIEQPMLTKAFEPNVLTRQTQPFLPARVDAVLAEIALGEDLTAGEKGRVVDVLREFADCFARRVPHFAQRSTNGRSAFRNASTSTTSLTRC